MNRVEFSSKILFDESTTDFEQIIIQYFDYCMALYDFIGSSDSVKSYNILNVGSNSFKVEFVNKNSADIFDNISDTNFASVYGKTYDIDVTRNDDTSFIVTISK